VLKIRLFELSGGVMVMRMKMKILLGFSLVLLLALSASSFEGPDGFGGYRWGQSFEEFQFMGPLIVDEEDGDLALSVALKGPKSWKNLLFRGSPSYIFHAGRFEGVIAHGCSGQDEWETWAKTLEDELGPPSKGSPGAFDMQWDGEHSGVAITFDPEHNVPSLFIWAYSERVSGQ
jgi:hypothetical protein